MSHPTDTPGVAAPPECRIRREADGTLVAAAPAKINLNLLVGPAGDDGYHPLDSIVAKISLHDTLELRPRGDGLVTLACTGCDCGPAEENLVMRAATLLAGGRDTPGADIALHKAIPAGVGLGGGSSDAAAALAALAELWRLGLSEADLRALARQLGSDVPLFLAPACSRMTGRGEVLQPMAIHEFFVALVLPSFSCSTADVYRAYDLAPSPIGEQLDAGSARGPRRDLPAAQPPSAWRDKLVNDLAAPARRTCPQLAELWDRLAACADVPVHLTGSGSGLFALFDTLADAQAFGSALPADLRGMCVLAASNPW